MADRETRERMLLVNGGNFIQRNDAWEKLPDDVQKRMQREEEFWAKRES